MAARRQVLSHDDWVHPQFYQQTTPRKWRTVNYATNVSTNLDSPGYQSSLFHQQNHGYYTPNKENVESTWVGKKLLAWEGESVSSYVQQIREMKYGAGAISEYEIAMFARPRIYRILYVDANGNWRSKPDVSYRAGRLNIMVGPDDVIKSVGYF